jgi:hypothetical protein
MIPEPVWFVCDADGHYHLPFDAPPTKTVIDVHGLARMQGVKLTVSDGQVTVECDGRTLVYKRVGATLHGGWICILQREGEDG